MTNSDRYSPDDYNVDQIDEDIVDQQGTGKAKAKKTKAGTKPVAGKRKLPTAAKRKPKASSSGTVAARLKRTDSETDSKQDRQKAGANTTAKSVKAKTAAKKPAVKKPVVKKPGVKVTAQKTAKKTAQKTVKKTATNRVGKTALSKETTMKALAQQELVANSAARRKALKGMSSKGTPLKKGAETAGTGIVWTLLGIGLAACAGGTSYVDRPVTKEVPGDPERVPGERTADPAELAKAKNDLKNAETERDQAETERDQAQEALAKVLGNTGQVSKGLPRGAKIYLLDKDGNRVPLLDSDGNQIVTDVDGQFDISKLTPAQRVQLSLYGYEADLTGAVDSMTNETYSGGSLRSMPGKLASFSSPLTTLLNNLNSSEQQNVLNLLFPDSGITIDDILAQLNYRLVPEAKKDGFDEKSNIIEKMAIRVMATLERFVSEDDSNKSASEKAKAAIEKLVDAVNKVIDNNKDDSKDKQTVDDVEGLKSESEVQKQIEQAEKFGEGRPSAAPKNLSVDEDGTLKIALSDFGFSDAEIDEEFGAITFTKLPNGTLTFTATKTITYNSVTYNAGASVDVIAGQHIEIAWLEGGFTFTPAKDQTGDMQLEYQVEAKKKDKDYASSGPDVADPGAKKSKEVTLTIEVKPVNDTPADTELSGKDVLDAIQGVITAKAELDNATDDAEFTTAQAALQKALDALIDLNIGGRPDREASGGDKEKVAEFINATKALIEIASRTDYVASGSATKKTTFNNLGNALEDLKVAEVYRVVDGAVHNGGGLTPTDAEKTGLQLLMANNLMANNDPADNDDLNTSKKVLDGLAKPTTLNDSKAALTAFETFFTALSAVKAATNLGYMDDLATKADAVLAALDTAYDATGLADERADVVAKLTDAKTFFSTPATANPTIMKLVVDVDDAFAALKGADATNIVTHLKAFVDALGKLDAGDGNPGPAQSAAVITAATALLNELFNPAHTNAARGGYDTALQTLIDAQTDVNEASPPFTIGGADGDLFKAKLVKISDGASETSLLDNVYQWQLVLTGDAKPVGATYEITVTYNDADGASRTETYVLVQDVSEKGFYLSTDGGTNDKQYSGQHDVLNPNAGGPTLAEGQDRAAGREADNQPAQIDDGSGNMINNPNNVNDVTFSFTGGLPTGGKVQNDGTFIELPRTQTTSGAVKEQVTLVFASKDDGGQAAIIEVSETNEIKITLERGASGLVLESAFSVYFSSNVPDQGTLSDNEYNALLSAREGLRRILNDVDGLPVTIVDGAGAKAQFFKDLDDGLQFGISNAKSGISASSGVDADDHTELNNSLLTLPYKLPPAFASRLKDKQVLTETITIGAGEITLADGKTKITFAETVVTVATDDNGENGIEASERPAMTIYVSQDEGSNTDSTADDVWSVKAIATADIGTLAGTTYYVIGTIAGDGTYSPNMAEPTTSWTVHDDTLAAEDLDSDNDDTSQQDNVLSRVHEYDLAPASADNNNNDFHIGGKDKTPGSGTNVTAQTLTHVGQATTSYEGSDTTRTVELTRKTIETRLHEANFNGFKGVQVDGKANGEDGNINNATFSYAATGGRAANNLITVLETPAAAPDPVTITFAFDDAFATAVNENTRAVTITLKADATNAEIKAYLESLEKTEADALLTELAKVIDITDLTIVHAISENGPSLKVDGAEITISIPTLDPENEGDPDPQNIDEFIVGVLNEANKGLADLLAARNKVQPTIAEQVYNIDAGVIYLPAITKDGTVVSTDVRITFAAKTFTNFTFTDDDVTPENMEALATARTTADFAAKLAAVTGDTGYNGQTPEVKALFTALQTAYEALGTRGENRADLDAALAALNDDNNADAVTAKGLANVQALIDAAQSVADAAPNMGTVADERVAVTIYVSQDEGADTATTADDKWSAKAIPTADIGDLAGTTYYVIGTVDANGEPTMNTQGGIDETNSTLTYTVTTPMPGTIKHVINIRNVDETGPAFQAENGFRAPNDQDAADALKNVGAPDAFTGRHLVQKDGLKDGDPNNSDAKTFAYDASLFDLDQTPAVTGTVAGGDLTLVIKIGGGKLYSGDGKAESAIADTDVTLNHATLADLGVGDHKFKLVADRNDDTVKSIADTLGLTSDEFVLATFTITRSDNGTDQDLDDDTFTVTMTPNETGEAVGTADGGGQRQVAQDMTGEPAADFVIKGPNGNDANAEINEQATGAAAQKSFTLVATDADNVTGRNPNARLPITTKTEIITYELTADTANIDNEYASIDRNSGVLTFDAGVFDYENKHLREDAGGKYFLIQVKATSTSSLSDSSKDTTKIFKIYVQQANEAPTDLHINDGVEMMTNLVAAVNDAYQTLIDNDAGTVDATDATNIVARVEALKTALDTLKATYDAAGNAAAKQLPLQGATEADYNALVTAAQALLDHINAPANDDDAKKLTALNITADENNDITPLKLAFTNAIGAKALINMQGREARLTIEAGYEDNPVKLTLGIIKVTDSDAGDTHTFTIGGPLSDLFTVETDEGTGIHTLVYTGGTAGLVESLPRLAEFIGGRFTLPITVRDDAGETHTVNFSVVYETAFVTTPRLPADTTLADGNDQNTPSVEPEKLQSGETKTQTTDDVTQTVGGLFENANGSTPIVIGAVSLAGVPTSKIKGVTVTNGDDPQNDDYEVSQGRVDANGTFTPDNTTGQWWLLYTGNAAPDYEVQQTAAKLVLNFDIDGGRPVTGFNGQTGVQADGDDGNPDASTFSYSGGAVTVDTSEAAVTGPDTIGVTDENGFVVLQVTLVIKQDSSQQDEVTFTVLNNKITVTLKSSSVELSKVMDAFFKPVNDGGLADVVKNGLSQAGIDKSTIETNIRNANGSTVKDGDVTTPAELTVTVAEVSFYTASGEPVNISGATLTSATPGEQFVFAVKDENGEWVLELGPKPASGEFYVLTNGLTPGTTATTATSTELANTTGGTAVNDGTINLPTQVKLPYVVPLKNLDDSAPAFDQADDGVTLAEAPQKFKQATTDAEVNAAQVEDGTFTLTINGVEWAVTIATGAESIVMGAAANPNAEPATAAVNTLTITLAAGAGHTVASLMTAIHDRLSDAELQRLGLTKDTSDQDSTQIKQTVQEIFTALNPLLESGTHYDQYVRDVSGNKIVENSDQVGESAVKAPPEDATITSGADETPVVAGDATVKYKGGDYDGGVSTGIIVKGATDKDGDAIVYRLKAIDPNQPDQNDNALVTLAVVNGELTIVFKTGGPDFESVRGARKDGKYVFVVEAVSTSELGDDPADRSSRAGEQIATQIYEYNVTDSDEAPWEIGFSETSESKSKDDADNPRHDDVTVAGIQYNGTIAKIHFKNDASDIPPAADGAPANDKYDGVTIAIVEASFNGRQIDTAVFDVINPEDGNLTWADKTGGRTITFLDDGTTYEMKRGDKLQVKISVTDKDNSALSTTKDFEIVNGTVTLVTYDNLKTSYDTYSTTDNETNQKALKDAIDGILASEASFSGVGALNEDATVKTFLGILKSTGTAKHFWLVDHGDNHINSRFRIEEIKLDDDGVAGGGTTTFYALFLKAGADVRNFEAGYLNDLDIGYSDEQPNNAPGNVNNFTGWQFVDADGTAGGARFAFTKATWDGIVQPGASTNTPTAVYTAAAPKNPPVADDLETPEIDESVEPESLLITIHHNGGTFYHLGAPDDGHDSASGTATETLFAADLNHVDFDEAGETLKLYLVHNHGDNTIKLVKAADIADGQYRFAEVIITRGDNDAGGNPTFTVTSITRATGEFVNGGQLKTIADGATVGSETYQVRPVDVNEAPDNLRILDQTIGENGQPTSQIALDWADPTKAINTGGNTDADDDVLEGLKDGVIWTFDANGVGTPTYFRAPVNGKLALPDTGAATGDAAIIIIYVAQGANPAVPDLPENGWSLHAMTKTQWDGLNADVREDYYQVGMTGTATKIDTISIELDISRGSRAQQLVIDMPPFEYVHNGVSHEIDLPNVQFSTDDDNHDKSPNHLTFFNGVLGGKAKMSAKIYAKLEFDASNALISAKYYTKWFLGDDDKLDSIETPSDTNTVKYIHLANLQFPEANRFGGTIKAIPVSQPISYLAFIPVAEVASATATVTESSENSSDSDDLSSVILTAAHLRSSDEDGINTESNVSTPPVNIVYIITGYQDANYHQNNSQTADDDRNVKMGWVERFDGTSWVKLDIGGDTSKTDSSFTQADVNAGNVRFVSSGADGTTATFDYVVRDNRGGTNQSTDPKDTKVGTKQTATINITNVNDAPFVDNVKSHSFTFTNGGTNYTIKVVGDAANAAAVKSVVDGTTIEIHVQGGESVDQILDALFKTVDESHGAQIDGLLGLADKAAVTAADDPNVNTDLIDGIRAAMRALDGNAPQKTATDAERTFAENVPQTAVDASQGGITLTNKMFGIVDVDTSAEQVKIKLDMANIDQRQLLKRDYTTQTDSEVTREAATGLPSAGEVLLKSSDGKAGRILVKTDNDGAATDWKILVATPTDGTELEAWQTDHFTLKQLQDGHVVFLHEVSHEEAKIILRLLSITDGEGTTTFTPPASDAQQNEKDAFAETAEVELIVTDENDAPIAIGTNSVPLNELIEGDNLVLNTGLMGAEDYDKADGSAEIRYVITDLSGLTVGGRIQAVLERNVGTNQQGADSSGWRIIEIGNADASFTLADLAAGNIRLRHLGEHAVGDKGTLTFGYSIDDDADGNGRDTDTSPIAKTATIVITPENDRPVNISTDKNSIKAQGAAEDASGYGNTAVTFSIDNADDEEKGETGVATTYKFYFVTDDSSFGDHVFFTLNEDTGVMTFKSREEIVDDQGLQLKVEGEEYKVKIRVVDTSTPASTANETVAGRFPVVGDPDTPNADNVFEQTFQFAVRNFDYDWDYTGTTDIDYDDRPKAVEYQADDYAPETGKQTGRQKVGEFTVVLEKGYAFFSGDKFTAINPVDVPWGTITVEKSANANEGNKFIVYFTPKPGHSDLIALGQGTTYIEDYSIKVNVEPAGVLDKVTGKQVVYTTNVPVKVTFAGVNEAPSVDIPPVSKIVDYHGQVQEAWTEAELTAAAEAANARKQGTTVEAEKALIVAQRTTKEIAEGKWNFSDVDIGSRISNLYAGTINNQANLNNSNLVDTNAANDADRSRGFDIDGTYGTLTLYEDGTWKYTADATKTQQIRAGEVKDDKFYLQVEDEFQARSVIKELVIKITGSNDIPTLTFTPDLNHATTGQPQRESGETSYTAVRHGSTNIISTTKADEFVLQEDQKSEDGGVENDNNSVTGTWNVTDADNYDRNATKLTILVNGNNKITLPGNQDVNVPAKAAPDGATSGVNGGPGGTVLDDGNAAELGRYTANYGDIIFYKNGTWKYVLTHEADKIAKDEVLTETLNIRIQDEDGGISATKTIKIKVVGSNDMPHGISTRTHVENAPMVVADVSLVETVLDSLGELRITMGTASLTDDITVRADGTLVLPNKISYGPGVGGAETLPDGLARPAYVAFNGGKLTLTDITSNKLTGRTENDSDPKFTLVREANGEVKITFQSTTDINGDGTVDENDMVTIVVRAPTDEVDTNGLDGRPNGGDDVARQGIIIGNVLEAGARYRDNGITRDETNPSAASENKALDGVNTVRGTFDGMDVDLVDTDAGTAAADLHTFVIDGADKIADTAGGDTKDQKVTKLVTFIDEAKAAAAGNNNANIDLATSYDAAQAVAADVAGLPANLMQYITEIDGLVDALVTAQTRWAAADDLADNTVGKAYRMQKYANEFNGLKSLINQRITDFETYLNEIRAADAEGLLPLAADPAGTLPHPDRASNDTNGNNNALKGSNDDAKTVQKGTYGWLYVNKFTGEWLYRLDNADLDTQALDGGDIDYDEFTIIVTDEEGALVKKKIRIKVEGTDDAPVLYGTVATIPVDNTASESGAIPTGTNVSATHASGKFAISDVDTDDDNYLVKATVNRNDAEAISTLREFTFEAASRIASASITAGDDVPNPPRDDAAAGETANDLQSVSALDWNQHKAGQGDLAGNTYLKGKYGVIEISSDGSWNYFLFGENEISDIISDTGLEITKADLDRVNKISNAETRQDHFAIRVKDKSGLESNIIMLDINVTGTNDASVVVDGFPIPTMTKSIVPPASNDGNNRWYLVTMQEFTEKYLMPDGGLEEFTVLAATESFADDNNILNSDIGSPTQNRSLEIGRTETYKLYVEITLNSDSNAIVSAKYWFGFDGGNQYIPTDSATKKYIHVGNVQVADNGTAYITITTANYHPYAKLTKATESGDNPGVNGQQVSGANIGDTGDVAGFGDGINAHGYFIPTDGDAVDTTANLGLRGWSVTAGGANYATALNLNQNHANTMRDRAELSTDAQNGNPKVVSPDSNPNDNTLFIAGKYGVITLEWDDSYSGPDSTDGGGRWKWSYKLANGPTPSGNFSQAMIDALKLLNQGENLRGGEEFKFIITDSEGVETEHTITITVQGSNDAPKIISTTASTNASKLTDYATEAGGLNNGTNPKATATGRINFTDDDAEHNAETGKNAFTYLVKSVLSNNDGSSNGKNSKADPAGESLPAGEEGFAVNPTGNALSGVYGHLAIDPNTGVWTYTLAQDSGTTQGDATQALNDNETAWEKFAIRIRDNEGGVSGTEYITITITGDNDNPTAVHAFSNGNSTAKEKGHTSEQIDGDTSAAGAFTISDVDAENDNTNLGVYIVSTSRGTGAGGVTDVDGGGNDARTVVARYAKKVAPNAADNADNQPDISDGDVVEGLEIKGLYGTLTYNLGNHSWSYALGNDWTTVQELDTDDAVSDTFTFTFTDARGAQVAETVTINITGTNDRPVISAVTHDDGAGGSVVSEEGGINNATLGTNKGLIATGSLTVTDVDDEDDPTQMARDFTFTAASATKVNGTVADNNVTAADSNPANSDFTANNDKDNYSVAGKFGTLQIHADGTWTYIVNQDNQFVQWLDKPASDGTPDTLSERFAVRVWDGETLSETVHIEVTIEGANDAPVIASINDGIGFEGLNNTEAAYINGAITITDVDGDDTPADNLFDQNDLFTVKVTETSTVVNGGNAVTSGAINSQGEGTVGDPPSGVHTGKTAGWNYHSYDMTHGTLYIYEDGSYRFDIKDDNAEVNGLGIGEAIVKTVTLVVSDDTNDNSASTEFTITIIGADDGPVNGTGSVTIPAMTPTGTNQAQQTFSLNNFITDPDGDAVTYSISGLSIDGSAQTLTDYNWISISGTSLQITPQAEMKAGTYTVTITGTSSGDSHTRTVTGTSSGGSHTRTVTFTVNDAPLAKTDPTGSIAMSAGDTLGTIDYDTYFTDHNGRDQFTVTGHITGPSSYNQAVNFNPDGTLQGNLPDDAGAYTLTLIATPVQGATGSAQTVRITINAASNKPAFLGTPATALSVDETADIGDEITNGDFNARAAGRNSGQDAATGGVRYSLKGGTAADFMTDAEVNRYLEIDADGKVKVKAPLPNQDADPNVAAKLRAPVKFIVVAIDTNNPSRTTEHEVTLTINNVLDETPTFTPLTGLTATAGQTAFTDGQTKQLSASSTTETGGSSADRVVQFRESDTKGHANVVVDENTGVITLTGTPTAGTIKFTWEWKYAGQPDSAWQDGGELSITVNPTPAPQPAPAPSQPVPAQVRDIDLDHDDDLYDVQSMITGGFKAGDSGKTAIGVVVDSYTGSQAPFNMSIFAMVKIGDKLGPLIEIGFDDNSTLKLRIEFDDGTLSQVLTMTPNSSANRAFENAEFFKFDGSGNTTKDTLTGDDNSNTFLIDGDGVGSAIATADIISNFNSGDTNKDKIRLKHDSEAEDATSMNIWYKLANLDGGSEANDMVIYDNAAGGDTNVLVILQNYSDTPLDDDFWENATITEAVNAATPTDIL